MVYYWFKMHKLCVTLYHFYLVSVISRDAFKVSSVLYMYVLIRVFDPNPYHIYEI
jgi:hypothetical protein